MKRILFLYLKMSASTFLLEQYHMRAMTRTTKANKALAQYCQLHCFRGESFGGRGDPVDGQLMKRFVQRLRALVGQRFPRAGVPRALAGESITAVDSCVGNIVTIDVDRKHKFAVFWGDLVRTFDREYKAFFLEDLYCAAVWELLRSTELNQTLLTMFLARRVTRHALYERQVWGLVAQFLA